MLHKIALLNPIANYLSFSTCLSDVFFFFFFFDKILYSKHWFFLFVFIFFF